MKFGYFRIHPICTPQLHIKHLHKIIVRIYQSNRIKCLPEYLFFSIRIIGCRQHEICSIRIYIKIINYIGHTFHSSEFLKFISVGESSMIHFPSTNKRGIIYVTILSTSSSKSADILFPIKNIYITSKSTTLLMKFLKHKC